MADDEANAGLSGLDIAGGGHVDAVSGSVAAVAAAMLTAIEGHNIARGAAKLGRAESEICEACVIAIGIGKVAHVLSGPVLQQLSRPRHTVSGLVKRKLIQQFVTMGMRADCDAGGVGQDAQFVHAHRPQGRGRRCFALRRHLIGQIVPFSGRHENAEPAWTDIGGGTVGSAGPPTLVGTGDLTAGSTASLSLANAPAGALMLAWLSFAPTPAPYFGGTVHALPFNSQFVFSADAAGQFSIATTWPAGIPTGTQAWFQFLVEDPSVIWGITLSNALRISTP